MFHRKNTMPISRRHMLAVTALFGLQTLTACSKGEATGSGDIVVMLKPHITPIADTSRYVSTHGSPWDYDRRVPVAFWRRGMVPSAPQQAVETADIMPTLAALLGLPLAAPAIDGHCLDGMSGLVCGNR